MNHPDFEGVTELEQMYRVTIERSKKSVEDYYSYEGTPSKEEAFRLASAMLSALMEELDEMSTPLLSDTAWVAGFLAGVSTAENQTYYGDLPGGAPPPEHRRCWSACLP
jgi:hypothetical protein